VVIRNLVKGSRGVFFRPWPSVYFVLGHLGFMYFPHSSPPSPLHTYTSTYQIPRCHSLIAVVIPTARFFSYVPQFPLSLICLFLRISLRIAPPTFGVSLPAYSDLFPTLLNTIWPCTYTWFYTSPVLINGFLVPTRPQDPIRATRYTNTPTGT